MGTHIVLAYLSNVNTDNASLSRRHKRVAIFTRLLSDLADLALLPRWQEHNPRYGCQFEDFSFVVAPVRPLECDK